MKNFPTANVQGGFGHYFDVEVRPGGEILFEERFCSAGLYAGSIDSSIYPPEVGVT